MKKIIVLIVLLWGLLLVAGTAHLFAQISSEIRWGEVEERIANAPSARDYPLADALILLEKRNIKLNSDGSVVDRHYRLVKIFTEVGRSLFADPRFDFNKATQEVKILTARTHMRDGKVVDVPENAINLLTPFSVSKAPAYCNLQQWVVSHTALETDAVIELEVETTTQSDPQNYLFGEVLFNSYYPVLEKEFTITLPTSIELNYVFKPKAIQPLTKEENGFRSYTWKLKDLVAIPLEKDGASLKELSQRLLYSTCPSWDTIVAKFRQNFVSALPLSVEAKGKVAALTKNANDVGEKLAAIHSYFLEEVNAVKCDPSLLNYKIRPLEEIYRSNYGHSLDEAALLVAMLEEAGIPANLALVADAGLFSKAIASPKQF